MLALILSTLGSRDAASDWVAAAAVLEGRGGRKTSSSPSASMSAS